MSSCNEEGNYLHHDDLFGLILYKFFPIMVLIFLSMIIEPIQCQQNFGCYLSNIYDISQGNWQIENNMASSDFCLSEHGKDSNFGLIIQGPCKVSFQWEVLSGYDYLEFFDNGTSKGTLGKMDWKKLWHQGLNKIFVYDITDTWQHELRFSHRNNVGIGSARIYNICVEDKRISNIYPSVQPDSGIATNMSCNMDRIENAFNYSVQIDTRAIPQKVELFTLAPGCQTPVLQGEGTFDNHSTFFWKDIKLKSNIMGQFQYWFRINIPGDNQPIESEKIIGPDITNIIINAERSPPIAATNCFNESYFIVLEGSKPRTIHLNFFSKEKNSCSDSVSQSYQPSDKDTENSRIYFNETWCKNVAFPASWEFELI